MVCFYGGGGKFDDAQCKVITKQVQCVLTSIKVKDLNSLVNSFHLIKEDFLQEPPERLAPREIFQICCEIYYILVIKQLPYNCRTREVLVNHFKWL